MKQKRFHLLFTPCLAALMPLLLLLPACAQQQRSQAVAAATPIAFPGAEGFGRFASGGRGGHVYVVTSLEDDGPGTLRAALKKSGPRIIVFAVAGTIHLRSPLAVHSNTTLAGQSAPGDGVCIADHPVSLKGNNIIVRYLRFRLGDRYQNKGQVHGSGHDDALSASGRKHIIIDHCSISWSADEALSVYNGDSTTVQWNIISEPLNYSYHFETGDNDFERHGYGGIWGGRHLTAQHNLIAHCASRNPRFAGIRTTAQELVDYRNNVIYNWGHNNVYGGEGGQYNLVGNYYKWGPDTREKVRARIVNPSRTKDIPFGSYHVSGNHVDGAPEITASNRLGVHPDKASADERDQLLRPQPFAAADVTTQSATEAYASVLAGAGASYRRDTLDQRIVENVRQRTGRIIDVQGGLPHGTAYEATVHAWPTLRSAAPPADGDGDGLPDEWERRNGLNPADPSDAAGRKLHAFYTNIEVYLNSFAPVNP